MMTVVVCHPPVLNSSNRNGHNDEGNRDGSVILADANVDSGNVYSGCSAVHPPVLYGGNRNSHNDQGGRDSSTILQT